MVACSRPSRWPGASCRERRRHNRAERAHLVLLAGRNDRRRHTQLLHARCVLVNPAGLHEQAAARRRSAAPGLAAQRRAHPLELAELVQPVRDLAPLLYRLSHCRGRGELIWVFAAEHGLCSRNEPPVGLLGLDQGRVLERSDCSLRAGLGHCSEATANALRPPALCRRFWGACIVKRFAATRGEMGLLWGRNNSHLAQQLMFS